MTLTLPIIEQLAPDQSSLKAAASQRKAGKWPLRARDPASVLIWGECQGSGANPYRVIANTTDHGYKCTCPSRKFPCKHVLALMWMYVEDTGAFHEAKTPDWVDDWVGRRRGPTSAGAEKKLGPETGPKTEPKKSLSGARDGEEKPSDSSNPKAEARRKAAARKRAEATRRSVLGATEDMEQWISDQLRTGLSGFLGEVTDRCRRIAARLVDAKAATLASRIDELPARVLNLPAEERLDAVVGELGRLVLLARAWRARPEDPELRRAVVTAESREQVMADPTAPRVNATWEVLGEQVATRRDGLVSQATWLLNLEDSPQRFAVLLDFFPASTGRRGSSFTPGEQFQGELVFYPARCPLRAIIASREAAVSELRPWGAVNEADPLRDFVALLEAAPWSESAPVLVSAGCVCGAPGKRFWWRSADGAWTLPMTDQMPDWVLGMNLSEAAGIWTGSRLQLLAAQSDWGRLDFHA